MNLDSKCVNGGNDIKGSFKNAVACKAWVVLPDGRGSGNHSNFGDVRHDVNICEVNHMFQTPVWGVAL